MPVRDVAQEQTVFCRAEHGRLVAAMTLYTGSADLGQELAQEALARACRDWQRVSSMKSPEAWTYRVAVNHANSLFRRRRYERLASARAAAWAPTAWLDPDPLVLEPLRRALASLPRRQREAVVCRYLLDLSIEEAASRMNCASGTVRALTAQAVSRLRTHSELADLNEGTVDA